MIKDKNCFLSDSPQDECGVFGIYVNDDTDSVMETYKALYALQHRGQESAGIVVNNNGTMKCLKNVGTVSEAFSAAELDELERGKIAVGHVCYSPEQSISLASTQPLLMRYIRGSLALAHNGALTNKAQLYKKLEQGGAIFQSSSNAELIAYVIASMRLNFATIEETVVKAMNELEGAYSIVLTSPSMLIGVRDPNGFRPLCIGKKGDNYMLSSESCAFDSLGAEFVRDVEPGEVVVIDENGIRSFKENCKGKSSLCLFEYVYVARPDSVIDGVSVYMARQEAGKILAREHPVEADMVCGVPDSGLSAALGYSIESGIPYGISLIKNKYIGRTFAERKIPQREKILKIKINVLKAAVEGKRIIIIDDSIVHGATCAYIVKLLKSAGAKEVHVRISSPPFLNPCYYGIDISDKKYLVSNNMSTEELCKKIGADSLGYLSLEGLHAIAKDAKVGLCDACFSGNYPAPVPTEKYEDKFMQKIDKKK